MTSKEQLDKLVEIASAPICDASTYAVAAQHINALIVNARKVFGGLSTKAQFAEFTTQASRNLTGSEIGLLVQFLNRFLFDGPLIDGGRTALRKDVTLAELAHLKKAADFLQINFQISATALGMMRIFTKRTAAAADFWGMTPADMEKELSAIAPQADMVDDFKKMVREQFAAMGGKLDTLQGMESETQAAAKKAAENSETTGRIVLNHLTPRTSDYVVKQKGLSEILEKLMAKVTVKTIQRWEAYLKTNGKQGTKPPDGYTLQTRQTLAGAKAWAETYAANEKSKLNTKLSLEHLTGRRH